MATDGYRERIKGSDQTFEVFLCSLHGPLTEARLPQCPYCYDLLVEKYEEILDELRAIRESPQYAALLEAAR